MEDKKKNYNKQILEILSIKPVVFNPLLAKITGSVKAGLLLSQLLYWWGKGKEQDTIYKTIKEIEEETALSRYEQENAIKKLKKLGLIEVELKGIPAIRHFKLNLLKINKLVCGKPTNLFAKKPQTNTDSTSDNTTYMKEKEKEYKEKEKEITPIRKQNKYSSLDSLGELEFEEIANNYHVPISFVRSCYDDLVNYCEAHGRRYKNYLAALRNFVKKDMLKIRREVEYRVSKGGIDARHIK